MREFFDIFSTGLFIVIIRNEITSPGAAGWIFLHGAYPHSLVCTLSATFSHITDGKPCSYLAQTAFSSAEWTTPWLRTSTLLLQVVSCLHRSHTATQSLHVRAGRYGPPQYHAQRELYCRRFSPYRALLGSQPLPQPFVSTNGRAMTAGSGACRQLGGAVGRRGLV